MPISTGSASPPGPDDIITSCAAAQHGAVTRAQLLQAGLAASLIEHRVRSRRLKSVFRGVYQVGPVVAPLMRPMAASLACGTGALVSYCAAACIWRMRTLPDCFDVVDITVAGRRIRTQPGIRIHWVASVSEDDHTVREGIPVTTPARTLCDIASILNDRALERAVAEAFALRLVDRAAVLRAAEGRAGRARPSGLLRLLELPHDPARTRSEAEEQLLALIRKAGLEPPMVNGRVAGYEVDFCWQRHGLVVEVDGHAFHSARHKFEADRRRDAVLTAGGYRVLRTTWRQITQEPEALLIGIARALDGR